MDTGSNKSLFTLIAVVIFGIFLSLSYWLFQDELVNVLADVLDSTSEMTSIKLDNNGLIPTEEKYFSYTIVGETVKITDYKGTDKKVIIPAYIGGYPVTTIGNKAFLNKGLTSITIPEGVTTIEDGTHWSVSVPLGAFRFNPLTEINLPNSLKIIGIGAFAENKVVHLDIPFGVTTIKMDAFYKSLSLKSVDLPNTLTYIGQDAFEWSHLENLVIPNSVTTIGYCAFNRNDYLTKLTLSNNLINIGSNAFSNSKITEVNISDSVKTIDQHAFSTTNLTSVSLPTGITLGYQAFPTITNITYR